MAQFSKVIASSAVPVINRIAEMRRFIIVWVGQLISTIGSGMTAFALGVHVYRRTGSATDVALIFLSGMLPRAIVSPFAGVLADRLDRRKLMIVSDIGAGLSILVALALAITGQLQVWQIYLITAANAAFSALRTPSYIAAAGTLVPKGQYGRVGGLIQLSDAMGQVVAPVVAGLLVSALAIQIVLLIDLITFVVALFTLSRIDFPEPTARSAKASSFLNDVRHGWDYLIARPGLMALLVVFIIGNFFIGNAQALLMPMVLAFATPQTLGTILSVGGAGMLIGGIVLSIWGGGRRRIYTILGFYVLLGIANMVVGLVPSPIIVAAGVFLAYLSLPFIIGTTQALLTSKVARDVQGRVFSLRIMLVTLSFTLAYTTAGPLADRIFEPLLHANGPLTGSVGQIIGVGQGRGMALMFVLVGVFAILTALGGFAYGHLRRADDELPDAETH